MRNLQLCERGLVSGGMEPTGIVYEPTGELGGIWCPALEDGLRAKNNNGYGNGAESGPPPGNSGDHNPQLLRNNLGPRGPRLATSIVPDGRPNFRAPIFLSATDAAASSRWVSLATAAGVRRSCG